MPKHPMKTALALGLASAALSGCVSFGSKPPPQLLTLSADSRPATGTSLTSDNAPSLTVVTPDVPRKIDNVRVPVQVDATTVAYVKNAQWAEAPRLMFQRMLIETIAADGTVFVLSDGQYAVKPGRRLMGELLDFGVDARSKEAVVTFDAILSSGEGRPALRQRFSARMPVRKIDAKEVAAPLNRAANEVAAQVTAWVKAN
mgnify:FL=1